MPKHAKNDISTPLGNLAKKIALRALGDNVSFEDQVEAFKVLTTYHVNTTKVRAKTGDDDDDDDEGTFDGFRKRIDKASTGG